MFRADMPARTQKPSGRDAAELCFPFAESGEASAVEPCPDLAADLLAFCEFGTATRQISTPLSLSHGETVAVPTFVNEFWTAKQRQANSLHEVSYRACFKPQLPRFFIERLTRPGDVVYDPFMGRGTTLVEAALLGRVAWGNDINPLSITLTRPRLNPPHLDAVVTRLRSLDLRTAGEAPEDLLVFYHPETLRQIMALREYFLRRLAAGEFDDLDDWLRLVALNRLTGHSSGFFSVYTLPPNQAVSVQSQRRINERRQQVPPRRDVAGIILKKSRQLLADVGPSTRQMMEAQRRNVRLTTAPADATVMLPEGEASLVVTSPPFLDVVQYAADNWLRCWFIGLDAKSIEITTPGRLEKWRAAMTGVLRELQRLLKPGGHVAFEVGEVHGGSTKLEDHVLPAGVEAGLEPLCVVINDQQFTKTANCWGVANMAKGTNTNRIVLFRRG